MKTNRQYLTEDIKAMLPKSQADFPWLMMLSEEGLYHLWMDLRNLTMKELTE